MDPTSKPKDPVYSAIVRDPSGYCRLIYRANNNCRPSNVKKGKFYRISGEEAVRGVLKQVGVKHRTMALKAPQLVLGRTLLGFLSFSIR